ncbi:MAG: ATP-binding protein [Treponemataceae bacterium]|nr:ATP-binding protein [Treponemataceae bacterium]
MTGYPQKKSFFSSLRFKFSLVAALISLFGFGIALHFSTRWMAEEIETDYQEKASLIGIHILHDLENGMLRINHQEIFDTLSIYEKYKDVVEARIYNSRGEEVFQKGKKRYEPKVVEVLKTGREIQFQRREGGQKIWTFIVPIKNKPLCHSCHRTEDPLRGAFLLSLSLKDVEQFREAQTPRFILFFGILTVSIVLIVGFTVNRLLLKPLGRIRQGAEAIARGDFSQRIPVRSYDEVGDLARHFNEMAETLGMLFQRLNEKRQELEVQFELVSRSRRQWQETFDSITDPMVVMGKDCTIHQANKAFRTMFQAEMESFDGRGEARDRTCRRIFGTCFLSVCPLQQVIKEKTSIVQEVEYPQWNKIFEVSVFPFYRFEDQFEGSIIILKDVTQKKEQERKAMLQERLSTIGQTVSSVAHELNNPLATIGISVEGLLKRVKEGRFDPALFENYLKIMRDEIVRSQKITSSLLSFVRQKDRPKEELDLHDVLEKTIEMLRFQGKLNGIEVLKDYSREVGRIRVHEGDLRQVLLSILNNAIEAMGERGRITLETAHREDKIAIKISDTGPGIPPEHLEKVFAPFFTTKSDQGGTGLGLFIAKKIIEENGGGIEVTSEMGTGSTFTITLPASTPK